MSDARRNEGAGPGPGKGRGPMGFGPGGMGRPVEKPKDFKGSLSRLVKLLGPYRARIFASIALAIASTAFSIYAPQVVRLAMNKLQDAFVARSLADGLDKVQARVAERMAAFAGQVPEGGSRAIQPGLMAPLREFMAIPRLSTIEDPAGKADAAAALLRVLSSLPPEAMAAFAGTGGSGGAPGGMAGSFSPGQAEEAIRALRESGGRIDFNYIGIVLLGLLGIYALSALLSLGMQLLMVSVSQETVVSLRSALNAKLDRLPLRYFDGRPHGEVLSRMTNDVDTIAGTLQQSLTQVISSIVSILGFVIMMLTISLPLTLIVLLSLPLYIATTMAIAKRSQKLFSEQQKRLGELSGIVEENFSGHAVVKAFGREGAAMDAFRKTNAALCDSGGKAQFLSGIMFPLMNFVSNLAYVAICVVGGLWIAKQRLKIGDMTAFITYSRSFTQPIIQTANVANIIQSTVACAERVFQVLDEPEQEPESPGAVVLAGAEGAVAFEGVRFSYDPGVPLIEDMDIRAKPGSVIAIVGPTGAGKTTLVNLLMRFYEVGGGRISVDGRDIRDYTRSSLRRAFGMVLQDTWLFAGSIRDNIAYARPEASEEEVIAAAKAAHADHFIRTLPEGYATALNEEASNISLGQRQLLTIARAILADPPILILDEATSSVDTRTEMYIQNAMLALMKARTSFVIAHRLSTIKRADAILVMRDGRLVEQGDHASLLARGGFYAELYRSQYAAPAVEEA